MAVRKATDPMRAAAMRQYAKAHDAHAECEQLLAGQGRRIEAEAYRVWARVVIRAWLAERDDPQPEAAA